MFIAERVFWLTISLSLQLVVDGSCGGLHLLLLVSRKSVLLI
jgi:hypothetical protein